VRVDLNAVTFAGFLDKIEKYGIIFLTKAIG
jgi:hypothetical protein